MASKKVRCNYCSVQIKLPRTLQAIQCPLCKNIIYVQTSDHLGHAHNSIFHTATRIKEMLGKASSNINVMLAPGSGTMGTGYHLQPTRPSAPLPPTLLEPGNSHSGSGTTGSGYHLQPTRPSAPLPPTLLAPGNSHSGSGTMGSGYHLQPTRPSAPLPTTSAHGKKRAVLCGVSYNGQRHKLHGTVNDVNCMRYFLTQKLGFPSDCILVLTEETTNPTLIPTKNNIRKALHWLVQGCQSGDSLVFHYSGHGSQQIDYNRDELDGYDEMIWPVDHQIEGNILDDEINATIVRPLPKGAKLHAIIDACHSGTILDLPYVCRVNREGYYIWEDHGRQSSIYKGTSGGLAISFSACDDHQVSADTTAFAGNASTGALTYSFIQALEHESGLSYGRLLNSMCRKINETKDGYLLNGPVSSFVRKVLTSRLSQTPQLSSSERFDIYAVKFSV